MKDWPTVQLRHLARMNYGDSLSATDRTPGGVAVFGSNGSVGEHGCANTLGPVIVIGRKGSHGKLRFSNDPVFAIDTTYYVDASTTEHHLRWLYYALTSAGLDQLTQDVGVPGLSRAAAYQQRLVLPPRESQQAIASYLDAETARIDSLCLKKQEQVERVAERAWCEQLEIATGRLAGHALARTDHEWLGSVPVHWPIKRLKFIARLESGHTPSRTRPELWENCTIPWITLNDVGRVRDSEFIDSTENQISEAGLAASSARLLPADTVVLSRDATVGATAIMAKPMATSQHYADWICGPQLLPRYLWLVLSTAMQIHFDSLTAGATLKTVGMPDVKRLVVPCPPLDEQQRLVEEAQDVRARVQAATQVLARQIALLKERRQALITAAVTGQLDIAA